MLTITDLTPYFARFTVIQPDFAISTNTEQGGTIWAECYVIDESDLGVRSSPCQGVFRSMRAKLPCMLSPETCVEFKWSTMVKHQTCIIAASGGSQRSLLPYGDTVDLRTMTGDLADRVPRVGSDASTKAFFAIPNSNDTLRITILAMINLCICCPARDISPKPDH